MTNIILKTNCFDANLVLCSFFTLAPNSNLSKELKLYSNDKEKIFENCDFEKLYQTLNRTFVRQLAYNISQPLLNQIPEETYTGRLQKISDNEVQILKKYLKKFKYFYQTFFEKKTNQKLTNKELNSLAIKNLFLIMGI